MGLSLKFGSKVMSAEAAAALIDDGDCLTVSGTVQAMLPSKLLRAVEVRFLTEGRPRDLTWFDPFPTGIPGVEPLSHPGLVRRVIGGWYTPHPRLREMIVANEVEAYLYPLGTLSFWCQAMAAGRDHYLTKVGLETYLDPRQGGGKLNAATTEEMVSLVDVAGEPHIAYRKLPITVALIRGTAADEEGNLSIEDEHTTMNVLYQALAAKRFGGKVIVQAKRLVPAGSIPLRLVAIPGALVDAIVLDPEQLDDDLVPEMHFLGPGARVPRPPARVIASANREGWVRWLTEGVFDDELSPAVRPLNGDGLIARRAVHELRRGDVVNIGQGLPAREILPVCIEEGIDAETSLSIETGHLGGIVNGLGFRANTTSLLDTPGIFSFYSSGLVNAAFFSMLEFDAEGSVNLLRYGDTWVGPGGSMDIAHAVGKIVFCGTLKAGGLQAAGDGGRLQIRCEGAVPRAVERVQGVCFNGRKMWREGKDVLYVTERAVFRLCEAGVELIEVAPGADLERDVLGQMCFRPAVSPGLRPMDARIFTPGVMGVRERWQAAPSGTAVAATAGR
jgi:acyl CoA:acetate/3-ketoacid CoA transferase